MSNTGLIRASFGLRTSADYICVTRAGLITMHGCDHQGGPYYHAYGGIARKHAQRIHTPSCSDKYLTLLSLSRGRAPSRCALLPLSASSCSHSHLPLAQELIVLAVGERLAVYDARPV